MKFTESDGKQPCVITVQGDKFTLEQDKWYMLNIVKFKYIRSIYIAVRKEYNFQIVVVQSKGRERVISFKQYQLDNFSRYLLDHREDVAKRNLETMESYLRKQEYSNQLSGNDFNDIDFNKVVSSDKLKDLKLEENFNQQLIDKLG